MATNTNKKASLEPGSNHMFAMTVLTSLFFMWGFITCLNDILIPHLKKAFTLNYTEAMLIQFTFFGAYFIMSLPCGLLVDKIGYKRGIVTGLVTAGIGTSLFYPAAGVNSYPLFLGAFFILASGITLLQVAANPYVAVLGKEETASSRLNLTQAFNSLGTFLAPFFGSFLILSMAAKALEDMSSADKAAAAATVQVPYLLITAALFIIAAVIAMTRLPVIKGAAVKGKKKEKAAAGGGKAPGQALILCSAPWLFLPMWGLRLPSEVFWSISWVIPKLQDFLPKRPVISSPFIGEAPWWGDLSAAPFCERLRQARSLRSTQWQPLSWWFSPCRCRVTWRMGGDPLVGLFNSIMFPDHLQPGVARPWKTYGSRLRHFVYGHCRGSDCAADSRFHCGPYRYPPCAFSSGTLLSLYRLLWAERACRRQKIAAFNFMDFGHPLIASPPSEALRWMSGGCHAALQRKDVWDGGRTLRKYRSPHIP